MGQLDQDDEVKEVLLHLVLPIPVTLSLTQLGPHELTAVVLLEDADRAEAAWLRLIKMCTKLLAGRWIDSQRDERLLAKEALRELHVDIQHFQRPPGCAGRVTRSIYGGTTFVWNVKPEMP